MSAQPKESKDNKKRKRRRGDRYDGRLVRDLDTMHVLMPFLIPRRTDNEAVLNEVIDLTAIEAYLEKKNEGNPEFKYTFFHVICAATAKTFALRPRMNRFYAGNRLYERDDITLSFVVKKKFSDEGEEVLSIVRVDKETDVSPVEQVYQQVKKIVYSVRHTNETDKTTDVMDIIIKLPRPILKLLVKLLRWLDYHGWYPKVFAEIDPYYTSVFISNLGSIKMRANYHHLTNWGTNSVFVVVGEKKPTPFFSEDGTVTMKNALELGITIDERIADGYYFANSLRLVRRLLAEPELLDLPIMSPVEY
ncbi:MAG: 2-oxo acid dehydrogenase subunit E2 [Clostridiales bacterium]|jgi:hypothetical protein|nr:2-oxo acid dehydrogenase subunit E2 [Clostridiales bacterium]